MTRKKDELDAGEMIGRFVQRVVLARWKESGRDDVEFAKVSGLQKSAVSNCRKYGIGIGIRSLPGVAKAAGYDGVPMLWAAAEAWHRGDFITTSDGLVIPSAPPVPPDVRGMVEDIQKRLTTVTGVLAHIATEAPRRPSTPMPESSTRSSSSKIPKR